MAGNLELTGNRAMRPHLYKLTDYMPQRVLHHVDMKENQREGNAHNKPSCKRTSWRPRKEAMTGHRKLRHTGISEAGKRLPGTLVLGSG